MTLFGGSETKTWKVAVKCLYRSLGNRCCQMEELFHIFLTAVLERSQGVHPMRFRTEIWIGVLVAVCWMAGVAEGEPIEKGPYVQRVTPHEAVIHWVTLDETVRFGTSNAALNRTVSEPRHHEVTLTDLQPGTVYYYNVSDTTTYRRKAQRRALASLSRLRTSETRPLRFWSTAIRVPGRRCIVRWWRP